MAASLNSTLLQGSITTDEESGAKISATGLSECFSNTTVVTPYYESRAQLYQDYMAPELYACLSGFQATSIIISGEGTWTNSGSGTSGVSHLTATVASCSPVLDYSTFESTINTNYQTVLQAGNITPRPTDPTTWAEEESLAIGSAIDALLTSTTAVYTVTSPITISFGIVSAAGPWIHTQSGQINSTVLTVTNTGITNYQNTLKSNLISAYTLVGQELLASDAETQAGKVANAILTTGSLMSTYFSTFSGTGTCAYVTDPSLSSSGVNVSSQITDTSGNLYSFPSPLTLTCTSFA